MGALSGVCAVLLAGGRGTRLRGVLPGVPKPFIPCAGRPFIEWVIAWFGDQGVRYFVVTLGHLADVAEAALTARPDDGARVTVVREPEPLGTGGALRFALPHTEGASLVACTNADSLVLADLAPAWRALLRPEIDGVMVGLEVEDASRFGTLATDADGYLTAFREKVPGRGVINAGVYIFKRAALTGLPARSPLSMEHDVFPGLLAEGRRVWVHCVSAPFLDIGTPESLPQAGPFLNEYFS